MTSGLTPEGDSKGVPAYERKNPQNYTSSEGYYIAIEVRFSLVDSYHRGEFIEPKGTLWAPQNVLVQKILLQIVTENVIESLRFFTLLIKMVANCSAKMHL